MAYLDGNAVVLYMFGGITEFRIVISLRMIIVYATSFTSQNTFKSALEEIVIKQNARNSLFQALFRRSLESGLLARVPFLTSGCESRPFRFDSRPLGVR